jgi:hypothetical protein
LLLDDIVRETYCRAIGVVLRAAQKEARMGLLDDLGKQFLVAARQAVTGGQTNQLAQGMMMGGR